MKSKVKGFTLVEILISMILSAIIISASYLALRNISKTMQSISQSSKFSSHSFILYGITDKLIQDSDSIYFIEYNELLFYSSDTSYASVLCLDSSFVYQSYNNSDTFYFDSPEISIERNTDIVYRFKYSKEDYSLYIPNTDCKVVHIE